MGSNPTLSAKRVQQTQGFAGLSFFILLSEFSDFRVRTALELAVFALELRVLLVANRVQIRFCYFALLGYIFPPAPEIIRPRKKHSLLPCLRRGYLGAVVEMGITVDEGSTGGYVAFN